jgi:hypothetical protein
LLEESEKEKREDGKMLERVLKGCLMVDAKMMKTMVTTVRCVCEETKVVKGGIDDLFCRMSMWREKIDHWK